VENILTAILIVPLLGVLFASLSRDVAGDGNNVLGVGMFTILSNLVLLGRAAQYINIENTEWQLVEKYSWLENPQINLVFGIDIFSLLLIAAVHFAVLLGMIGVRRNVYRQKALIVFSLLFLTMISGYFMAADLFSFYIFFEAMLLPLFMLAGIFGDIKRRQLLYRFFIYNLLGAVFLFMALTVLYNYQNVGIKEVSRIIVSRNIQTMVWGAVFIAFLSRIPVWPFHYWIASVNANISNPLVFIIANLMPLTGVYGLIRFFPVNMPEALSPYLLILEALSIITMLMIALIGFIKREIQYKLFAYMTIYYIFYLLGALLPTDRLLMNIGFSLFSFLVIIAAIEVLVEHIEDQKRCNDVNECGILGNIKRTAFLFSFLILAAIGMPLSSLFLNNLVIFAGLMNFNIKMAVFILVAVAIGAVGLLQQLFYLRYSFDDSRAGNEEVADISMRTFVLMLLTIGVLLLSFVNPLWFII